MAADWNPGVEVPSLIIRSIKFVEDKAKNTLIRYNSLIKVESSLMRSNQNYSGAVPTVLEGSDHQLTFLSSGVVTGSKSAPVLAIDCALDEQLVVSAGQASYCKKCQEEFGTLPSDATKCVWCVDMYKAGTSKPMQVANDIFGTTQSYVH